MGHTRIRGTSNGCVVPWRFEKFCKSKSLCSGSIGFPNLCVFCAGGLHIMLHIGHSTAWRKLVGCREG